MKKLKYIILAISGLLLALGCDKDFEKINKDPNNPTSIPSTMLIADLVKMTANTMYSTFNGADMGSCWAQHWAKVQYNTEERYSPRQLSITDIWNDLYEDVVSDAYTMENLAITEENKASQGVALVLQAYGLALITDLFGDVPCSEAIQAGSGNFTPVYDPQAQVYDTILLKLDKADQLLASGEGSLIGSFDLMYQGNVSKWRKFANSLKFRALMRISGVRDVSVQLQALINKPMFGSIADEAKLVYLSENPNANPVYETIVVGARGEYKLCESLVNNLVLLSDPRLPVYAQKNTDGEYRGKPAGIKDVPNDDYNYDNVSPIGELYIEPTAPGYFLSYPELQFLMAEAAQRGLISGDASTYYTNAIVASMTANEITDYADYIASNSVTLASGDPLEKIGLQKWIALYGQGMEAWTEWRRVKIPDLPIAIDAIFSSSVVSIPARYNYPTDEQSLNSVNYKAAVERQGADLLTTQVWWMKF